jgi:hypothetical protein
VLIPAEEPQPAERQTVPQPSAVEAPATPTLGRNDFGSQSIVIAVDESVATSARGRAPASAPPGSNPSLPQIDVPQLQIAVPTIESEQPSLDTRSIEPVSPAVRYVARRERNRRNQFTLAVLLLIAVIMLAGVLIWVLRHNAQPPAEKATDARAHRQTSVYHIVRSSALKPCITANLQFDIS